MTNIESEELIKLIDQLSQRVHLLEGLSYRFWIPVVTSIIASVISGFAIFQNIKQSKTNNLQAVKSNIDISKYHLEVASMGIAPLKAKKTLTADEKRELEIKNQVHESTLERLLNGYNSACQRFYKKQVIKQDFIDMYHEDIRTYIEAFPDKFSEPLTRFDMMLKYHKEYHKKPKA